MSTTLSISDLQANADSAQEKDIYSIGDLSREFGVTLRTLRFYEDKGLISPQRRGTTRLYNRRDRARLQLILRGKKVGFSLEDIKEMLDLYDLRDGQVTQFNGQPVQVSRSDRRAGEPASGNRRGHRRPDRDL
jgi:DNA-binding transcriptional MerR regulator